MDVNRTSDSLSTKLYDFLLHQEKNSSPNLPPSDELRRGLQVKVCQVLKIGIRQNPLYRIMVTATFSVQLWTALIIL